MAGLDEYVVSCIQMIADGHKHRQEDQETGRAEKVADHHQKPANSMSQCCQKPPECIAKSNAKDSQLAP